MAMVQPGASGGGSLTVMSPPAATRARVMPCFCSTCWASSAAYPLAMPPRSSFIPAFSNCTERAFGIELDVLVADQGQGLVQRLGVGQALGAAGQPPQAHHRARR